MGTVHHSTLPRHSIHAKFGGLQAPGVCLSQGTGRHRQDGWVSVLALGLEFRPDTLNPKP